MLKWRISLVSTSAGRTGIRTPKLTVIMAVIGCNASSTSNPA